MSVNLQKGQKVDLTKGNSSLRRIIAGLGWDEAAPAGGGLLGGLMGGRTQAIDCDASAFLCNAAGKLAAKEDVVYFGNLKHVSGSILHMGDNLTGAGDGDDEQIVVDLSAVPPKFERIVFVVNIYEADKRRQDFGRVQNAFIRLVDADKGQELCRYNLTENYSGCTALIFGEVYRRDGEWKFSAIGQGTKDIGISQLAQRYM
ncbi:MAG: TerD family protein [Clostridiales bacterium]|jgi:stress response protein SCP2|nr:TerD family protein [Clostridiales bacterium]